MTEDELKEIEVRASKATPGPWRLVTHYDSGANVATARSSERHLCIEAGACVFCRVEGERAAPYENDIHNAEFIAASRSDVPALVLELRRLQVAEKNLRDLLARYENRQECCHSARMAWGLLDDAVKKLKATQSRQAEREGKAT